MSNSIIKLVVKILRDTANKLDAGTSELSETEAMDIMSMLTHHVMSKESACKYLQISRSKFDDLVSKKKLPSAKSRVGFKEKVWYQDELDNCIKTLKK